MHGEKTMTPVATPVAVRATSWDAALEETLSRAARPASPGVPGPHVHSVHARVLNVRIGADLVAVIDDSLDDAPASIRVPFPRDVSASPADPVLVRPGGLVLRNCLIDVTSATAWHPEPADLSALSRADIARALRLLPASAPQPVTPFGRASAALLRGRAETFQRTLLRGDDRTVSTAAHALIGLGEGLTPAGDDILTGATFLAAQPGMRLGARLDTLRAAIAGAGQRTTLLSAVTLNHALHGRSRQRMHDLAHALSRRDTPAAGAAIARVREIGHTSGEDLLTGIRLALTVEHALRPSPHDPVHE